MQSGTLVYTLVHIQSNLMYDTSPAACRYLTSPYLRIICFSASRQNPFMLFQSIARDLLTIFISVNKIENIFYNQVKCR